MQFVNIAGYKFLNLANLDNLKGDFTVQCTTLGLKGTILLSTEGINVFLCGSREGIDSFYEWIAARAIEINFKESISTNSPFKKMSVKIKSSIIPLDLKDPAITIDPQNKPAPQISAQQFKQWLDQEKPMVILDARNDYEVRLGKFKNAVHLPVQHFRHFEDAIAQLPNEYKNRPIVTYCTGGIRCEKAAPLLIEKGFHEVYQLEGGILQYLEECGGSHYEGECFVFDKRIAVDSQLRETATVQCIKCREPVTLVEQSLATFEVGKSCPHCH
jgi:UPF0176 protein